MAIEDREKTLREMARHRGFKLAKSRRRKPGAGDYGLYGLTDAATGQDCFGIGKDGLEASAEEIENYLRGSAKATWKRSLASAGKMAAKVSRASPRKSELGRAEPKPVRKPPLEPAPAPVPEPERIIREATAKDAAALAELLGNSDRRQVAAVLRALIASGVAPLVAQEQAVLGCVAYQLFRRLGDPAPIGRITVLVVAPGARLQGIGSALLEAAEARFEARGCSGVEAMSEIELASAHGFFRRAGYARTGYRFARDLRSSRDR